jgi:hypothetical protein
MNRTRLCSYKLSHDTGFAPNPFFGILTLATAMPDIRESAEVDHWIAGFTSGALCGDPVGGERLVFLMRVGEKISTAEYFADARFERKIPSMNGGPEVERHGDNIYHPLRAEADTPEHFAQLPNPHHWDPVHRREDERSKRQDLLSQRVLVAQEYVYFGRDALQVPEFARPVMPKGQSRTCLFTPDTDLARAFIDFALGKASRPVLAPPHVWQDGDDSWRQ